MKQEILRAQNLYVSSNLLRLENVNFSIYEGQTVAFLGMNRAGCDLAIDTISGQIKGQEGKFFVNEKPVRIGSESDAHRLGIFKISRESSLVESLDIAENIFVLRKLSFRRILLRKAVLNAQTAELLKIVGLDFPPKTKVSKLTTPQRNLVELAKAVGCGAKLILLENIYSLYNTQELIRFQQVLEKLKSTGISFIVACRNISEARLLSDQIFFFRDCYLSKKISTLKVTNLQAQQFMGYAAVKAVPPAEAKISSDVVFALKNLKLPIREEPLSFEVHRGEVLVLHIDDVDQEKFLSDVLSGDRKEPGTEFYLDNQRLALWSRNQSVKQRVICLSNLDHTDHLFENMSIGENLIFPSLKKVSRCKIYVNSRIPQVVLGDCYYKNYSCKEKVSGLDQYTRLSILLERWYIFNPKAVILVEPYQYCDIACITLVNSYIRRFVEKGIAVVMLTMRTHNIENFNYRLLKIENEDVSGEM